MHALSSRRNDVDRLRVFALDLRLPGDRCAGLLHARRAAAGVMIALMTLSVARTTIAASPVGLWYAEGGAAQVQIDPCDAALCGRVVWLRSPFDENGCDQRDYQNPDSTLRDRPIVGLEVLTGLRTSDGGRRWSGGTIYDPTSGRTYRCTAELDGTDRLRLRGFIGVPLLGRTTTWIRVGSENRTCTR